MDIRCDFQLERNKDDWIIVQNTCVCDEVRITIVKKENASYEFVVDGEMLMEAIKKCIKRD